MSDTLSIGEVINLLREDYPDVSVSKVRFLESQGLIAPDRTSGGYRTFDQQDLRRLRFILQQQRDHFLPLKVIKSQLTMWERGEEPDVPDGGYFDSEGDELTRTELLKRSRLTDGQLSQLEAHGLLSSVDERFPEEAVAIGAEARRLLAQGLEARHLRTILLGAEREAELLRQLTAPFLRLHHPEARRKAEETLANCSEATTALHRHLLVARLRSFLDE